MGVFEVEVLVRVGGENSFSEILNDDSGLCYTTRRQKFTLDVQAM